MKLTAEAIKKYAKELGAQVVGIGEVYEEADPQRDPRSILPTAESVIGFGFAVPKGLYRAMEHGNQYYSYTTLGVKYIDEEMAEIFLFKMGALIEDCGYDACLQKSVPNLRIKGDKETNPEVAGTYELVHAEAVAPGKPVPDVIIDFGKAAEACGIGSRALNGKIINEKYGPFMRYCFIITDAPLEKDPPVTEPLCDGCMACAAACTGNAISEKGLDTHACHTHYRNADHADPRLKDLPNTMWGYQPCLCGRPCDVACWQHLLKRGVEKIARENQADIVGIAHADRFPKDDPIFRIMPEVKSVIGLGFQVLRGVYRGVKEGTTYYQYTTMGVENMEETVMPMASIKVAVYLEEHGYLGLPQRRHETIMAEEDGMNPEVAYDEIFRGRTEEVQMDFLKAAVITGLGEEGFHHALLTDAYGPFVRYCFVLTDALLPETEKKPAHLCDHCMACKEACPGHAIDEDGSVDGWQCAVYYNGANGTKNPFMPPDAFPDFEDRLAIIAGEKKVDPESARKILRDIWFYPPAQHSFRCSICGRACDMACYQHLEEKGLLAQRYKTPFHQREDWHFSVDDFKETTDDKGEVE